MNTKALCLIGCTLFVFVAVENARAVDPNFAGWWRFDEGFGTTAADSIGGNDGTLMQAPSAPSMTGHWVSDKLASTYAYNFDGTTTCSIPVASLASISKSITITFWARGNDDMPIDGMAFQAYGPNSHLQVSMTTYSPYLSKTLSVFVAGQGWGDQYYMVLEAGAYKGSWHHFAYTKNGATGVLKIYIDGVAAASTTGMTSLINTGDIYKVDIGAGIYGGTPYHGTLDDFRLYNRALTDQEVLTLATTFYTYKAYSPNPTGNTSNVPQNPLLQWSAGISAASHNVYFGTSFDSVNNADAYMEDLDGDGEVGFSDMDIMAGGREWANQRLVGVWPPQAEQEAAVYSN